MSGGTNVFHKKKEVVLLQFRKEAVEEQYEKVNEILCSMEKEIINTL